MDVSVSISTGGKHCDWVENESSSKFRYEQLDLVPHICVSVAIHLVSVARNLLCSNDKRLAVGIRCPFLGEERLLFTMAHSSATQQLESGNFDKTERAFLPEFACGWNLT